MSYNEQHCPASSPVKHYKLPRRLVNRADYVLSECAGKRVLHVGCAAHSAAGNLERTVDDPTWLHRKLVSVCTEVIGIDNSIWAVKKLREAYGMMNIYVGDAEHLERLKKGLFDVIIAGEIIEHLACPGSFLRSAGSVLQGNGAIVITTVNAFCLRKLLQVIRGRESVHEDHVSYFSHRTLERLAEMHGYEVVAQCTYRITTRSPLLPYIVEKAGSLICPNLCEGVITKLVRSRPSSERTPILL